MLGEVLAGEATPAQIAALAVALQAKGESADEMTGFVPGHGRPTPSRSTCRPATDVVDPAGTGGDRLRSINVTTLAALVVAACGAKVCKHGGRASSSAVGAADVLEALGVVADLGPDGRGPLHRRGRAWGSASPRASTRPCASPARSGRELGIPTVFNFLGPLANPAPGPLPGGRRSATRPWPTRCSACWRPTGRRRAMVVHGDDGLDELSTTGPSHRARADPHAGTDDAVDDGRCPCRLPGRPADLGLAPAPRWTTSGG